MILKYKVQVKENGIVTTDTVQGELLDKVLVAQSYKVTLPSGEGSIITDRCNQYVAVHKFMILREDTGTIDLIDPINIVSKVTTE